jgi:hypothetical protein
MKPPQPGDLCVDICTTRTFVVDSVGPRGVAIRSALPWSPGQAMQLHVFTRYYVPLLTPLVVVRYAPR